MGEIESRAAAVVLARRSLLPEVAEEMACWQRADEAVVALDRAVADLGRHAPLPPRVVSRLGLLRIRDVRPAITATVERLQRIEGRFARGTLDLGVGGAAQAGKSTLAQSISGLDDGQVPTGRGCRVTAVRSRLVHAPGRRRVLLETHDYQSYRRVHLQPRHEELPLPPAPRTVAEYRAWRYPLVGATEAQTAVLADLRAMQEALSCYEFLLDRAGRPFELTGDEYDRLPEYVSFPSGTTGAACRHLAVRDARIECAFPNAVGAAFGICDLPASGGPAIEGLRHELDMAVLVKRVDGTPWLEADAAALRGLDEARGFVCRRSDFAVIALNTGEASQAQVESLRADIRGQLPEEYVILDVDVKAPEEVAARLLVPVLSHLGDRLPGMDTDVLAGTRRRSAAVREELIGLATDVHVVLKRLPATRAGDEHVDIVAPLRPLLAELRDRARRPDRGFIAAVDAVHMDLCGPGRTRTEISAGFAKLDEFLRHQTEQVRDDVGDALAAPLAIDGTGSAALDDLSVLATETAPACSVMAAALADLRGIRLDYHTQLHPRVRPLLDDEDAVDRVRLALHDDAALPGQVLFAAVERFADAVGGQEAERELQLLAHAPVARVARAADVLLAVAEELAEYRS